jgi:hypothetical protein
MERQEKVFKMALAHRTMYFDNREQAVHFKENVRTTEIQEMTWEQYDSDMQEWHKKSNDLRIKEA